jgi:predicted dehydrogenase
LKFKSGAIASLIGTTAAVASRLPRFEVFGEKGTLSLVKGRIEGGRPCDLLFSTGKKWKTIAGREPVSSRSYWSRLPKWTTGLSCVPSVNSLVRNLEEFLDSIISDKEPLVSGEEGRKSLEIMVAIYESSMNGQLVRFPVKP